MPLYEIKVRDNDISALFSTFYIRSRSQDNAESRAVRRYAAQLGGPGQSYSIRIHPLSNTEIHLVPSGEIDKDDRVTIIQIVPEEVERIIRAIRSTINPDEAIQAILDLVQRAHDQGYEYGHAAGLEDQGGAG